MAQQTAQDHSGPQTKDKTMAYATEHSTHAHGALEGRTAGLVARLRDALARRKLYRQTIRELGALSNRELSDLGLHRSMIRRIAYQAAYEA